MKTTTKRFSILGAGLWTGALVTVLFAWGTDQLHAKKKKPPTTKLLIGVVLDQAENPVPQAAVRLKNLTTKETRAVYADAEGRYRFAGLKKTADYEVQAEHNGLTSSARRISTFDTRMKVVFTLQLLSSSN